MDNVGTGHWIFAMVFAIGFVAAMVYAYREDIKKSPWYFKGSSRIAMIVVGSVFVLLVLKMLHRAMFVG
jgi:threonine/homoserine/homoserine lactone efflux protein